MDFFIYDERLGIRIPDTELNFAELSEKVQAEILQEWERIRGRIPDRIYELEQMINTKQAQLNQEEDFIKSCSLNSEISELASTINDLHLWNRINQETTQGKMHG